MDTELLATMDKELADAVAASLAAKELADKELADAVADIDHVHATLPD